MGKARKIKSRKRKVDPKKATDVLGRVTGSLVTNPNLGIGDESLSDVLGMVIEGARELMGFDQCALFLYDDAGESLELKASSGLPEDWKDRFEIQVGEGITGRAVAGNDVQVVPDRLKDDRRKYREADSEVRSMVSVPIRRGDRAIGAINFYKRVPYEYSWDEVKMLEVLTNCAATAVVRREKNEELRNREIEKIYTFVKVVEAKSEYHRGHLDRVTGVVWRISDLRNLSRQRKRNWRNGGRVHDVGKIYLRDEVLASTKPLTPKQWEEMRKHPTRGVELIKETTTGIDDEVLWAVGHHHEYWDGTGYPEGLSGKDIPEVARAVAIGDGIDAMTSRRPYKDPMPADIMVLELERSAGMELKPERAEPLILYRALEEMKRSDDVPVDVRHVLGYTNLRELLECAKKPAVIAHLPRFREIVTAPDFRYNPTVPRELYDQGMVEALLKTHPERYIKVM